MMQGAQHAWTTGFCDWCASPGGCGTCFYVCCCTPCAYGSNVSRMPPSVICGGSCVGACFAYMGMTALGLPCLLHMCSRGYVRQKYGIPGDGCTDCLATCCCPLCAMCQEGRELTIRGCGPGGIELNKPPGQQEMYAIVPVPPPAPQGAAGHQHPQQYPQQPPPQQQPYPQQQYPQQQYQAPQQQQYQSPQQQQYPQQPPQQQQYPQQPPQQQQYPPPQAAGYPQQQPAYPQQQPAYPPPPQH
ncbi:Protein PLANT CADMIUM RESISTANCE 3 [Tetrabaena socialis]|uniref:Protein PLANT CADMIUM RESISTANCE 3 n=1 Tax=Tetrabaena socialis TaxID=47790 RepID=A0A2J8AAL0_9CHLO|nr:Protein PLANT CADMIUM RESISTANCE 3 [Tetrabaena socialis]|eukprot:PNH09554.1 Protein PLANT CADMIUM RESISTANCE 3 [Tetrabaena socialis]